MHLLFWIAATITASFTWAAWETGGERLMWTKRGELGARFHRWVGLIFFVLTVLFVRAA